MPELIPKEFLRVIGIWSLVPSYLVAGGLIGYGLDQWFHVFPYVTCAGLLFALMLAVRDMLRLRDTFPRPSQTTKAGDGHAT